MKRTLSSAVLKKKNQTEPESIQETTPNAAVKPRLGGSGSAWKAGALTDAGQILQTERDQVVERILAGQLELRVDPKQIVDQIGTDRREDWRDQASFQKLKESIEKNGQDTPIHVWPADPEWRPDPRAPENVDGIKFHLIVGRRRHAILEALGRPVRVLLGPQTSRGAPEEAFDMLFMRFRENEERENLSAFERLVSIGEMYERLQEAAPDQKLSATDFASRVGLHNSAVSRGRAVFAARDAILHACKNVYDLSHRDLEQVLNGLTGKTVKSERKKPSKPKALTVQRKVGTRKLKLTGQGGKLTVAASGLSLDADVLNGLGDVIAAYLEKNGSK